MVGGRPMNETVLIVDDDEATRDGLPQLLTRAGYRAVAAGTYDEGATALRRHSPDLLIVDVRLGEYNGLQLIITADKRIPAIAVTGYADSVLEAEARHEGAEYLVKPVDPSLLLKMAGQMLTRIDYPVEGGGLAHQ